jgi:cell division protein FtsQ
MARKSGPTILQEELYPPSAEAAREEIDDARLLDLDAEEESPFLRGQKRVSARRSALPKKTANNLLWAAVAAGVICLAGLGAAWLYHYGEHSWRFRVESSDNIEVTGMQNVSKSQIMEVMGSDIGRNIFFIPLAQQKTQLEQIPWVESASVMRFVPNRLKVEIHERTPVAFARVGPRMSLIDAGGTLMELTPKHKYSFPVILGMNPGEPLSTRAPRMKTYAEMVRELEFERRTLFAGSQRSGSFRSGRCEGASE